MMRREHSDISSEESLEKTMGQKGGRVTGRRKVVVVKVRVG